MKIQCLSGMIIEYRYQNSEQFSELLEKYISEETFKAFNPSYEENVPQGCYVYFDSQIFDVKHNYEKAIVSYGYNYYICEFDSNNIISGSHVNSLYPCKIYLEKIDGIWRVADIFEAP